MPATPGRGTRSAASPSGPTSMSGSRTESGRTDTWPTSKGEAAAGPGCCTSRCAAPGSSAGSTAAGAPGNQGELLGDYNLFGSHPASGDLPCVMSARITAGETRSPLQVLPTYHQREPAQGASTR